MKARVAASVVIAAGLMLATSGCTFFAEQATLKHYDPSDGVGTAIGSIKVRNALLLSKDGEEASLLVNLVNDGQEDLTVSIQYTGDDGPVTSHYHLGSGDVDSYGGKGDTQIVFEGIDTEPGALLPVYFSYPGVSGQQLLVPVLDGTQSEYSSLLPSPSPTSTNPPVPVPLPSKAPAATSKK